VTRTELEQAVAFLRSGLWKDAERVCLGILAREPDHPAALAVAGEASLRTGNLQLGATRLVAAANAGGPAAAKAVADVFSRAVAAEPRSAQLHHWRGEVLSRVGSLEEAIAAFRRALSIDESQPGTHYCLAEVLMLQGFADEAAAAYRAVIRLVGQTRGYANFTASAYSGLGDALMRNGEQEDAIDAFRRAHALAPTSLRQTQLAYHMQFDPTAGPEAVLREAREWDRLYAAPLRRSERRYENDPAPERRLRIGYVSADFRTHAVQNFLPPLFERHDRAGFEVFAYSNVVKPDAATEWVQAHVDAWRDITKLDDDDAARRIREDRIDVLVDLSMHTSGERLLVFARAPAPVQVCWLAYPGTTGLRAMDYRVTDPHLDPPELDGAEYDRAYSEKPIRLADTFWCYRPQHPGTEVGPLPALSAGHVTFGCLNNFAKVTAGTVDLWARILLAVDRARCLLYVPSPGARERVKRQMERAGVSPDRVEFVWRQLLPEYLATYRRIDIGLDTLPCGGGTTSLDAFYMGVPLVTQVGRSIVGRAGLGIARNLGLPELVAANGDDYVRIACALAGDLGRLSEMRASLRARMVGSPLMDEARFVQEMERGLRDAWRRWCTSPARLAETGR
jgi:predicted O-linked N-acetylglucosamine transferase (SPINDLY family)